MLTFLFEKTIESITKQLKMTKPFNSLRVGVQAFNFKKLDFELWVGVDGLDMYLAQLEGGFGSMSAMLRI